MTSRRRFLTIMAGAALMGRAAGAAEWQGRVMGAEARLLIRAGRGSDAVLAGLRARIAEIEAAFSLHAPSELTRLNRTGRLEASALMLGALRLARRMHRATGGAFDPGVQPLWQALAAGAPAGPVLPMGGLTVQGRQVRLAAGQALTLNGLAQGIATDLVAEALAPVGEVLVDMGESRAVGGDFRLALEDPAAGSLGQITLRAGRAVATTSPGALLFASGQSHVIGPQGQPPLWSSVTVEASSAALADAASTAFALMPAAAIRRVARDLGLGPVRLVDAGGDLVTL